MAGRPRLRGAHYKLRLPRHGAARVRSPPPPARLRAPGSRHRLAARLPIPIATSSLIQIPAVRALLPAGKTVGVITFDEARLGPLHLEKLGIADAASIPVVGPPADGHLKRLVRDGGPYSQSGIEEEMVACARRLVEDHAGVGAIVLECVQMPPFAAAVQKAVGLPTYDVFTLGCWFYSGLARSPFAAWSAEEQEAVDRVYPREAGATVESAIEG